MSKGWRWAFGGLGIFVALIVLIVIFFDWNWLKPPLEGRLSALTGKSVRIVGPLTGEWAWVPHVTLSQIQIAESKSTAAAKVATIDRLTVTIDLQHLLRGRLDFPEIDIAHPVLDLRRDASGKANWDIAAEAKGPNDRHSMPIIGNLKIHNGEVKYRDNAKQIAIDAAIATLSAHGGSGEDSVTLDGQGTYRGAPFTIHVKGGALNDLRDTEKPYDVDLKSTVGDTKVAIVGTVTDPFKLTDMLVKLTAEGDNAEELYTIFGIPAPPTPPYRLTGTVDRDGDDWIFKNFSGTVGNSDLSGSLRFAPKRIRMFVSGNLDSKHLNFADLGLLVGAPGSTAPGKNASNQQRKMAEDYHRSDRVLPDAHLRLNEVRNVDADVVFKGEHVENQDLPLENADVHVKLDNAVLRLDPLRVGVAGGRIDATIVIDARNEPVATDYDVRFHKFQLQQFFQRAGVEHGATGAIDGRIRLHGIGDSVRRSLGSSTGEASAIVDNGTISNLVSDLLGLDIARSLGLLISGDQQIALRCMVTDFQVENGIMTPRIFILDTDATTVTGTGTISLAGERLDLALRGKQKKPSPLDLGGPITVGGTFKNPDFGLGKEAIVRGGAAVALGVILTPLASILGFIEPGDSNDADCIGLEHDAQNKAASQPPAPKPRHPAAQSSPPKT
jgi:uncharacterized protein involved in outer membrane biogenesis